VSDWTDYTVTTNAPIEKVEAVLEGIGASAAHSAVEVEGSTIAVSFFGKKADPNSFIFARELGYDGFNADRVAI
jgi:hypothetical protein